MNAMTEGTNGMDTHMETQAATQEAEAKAQAQAVLADEGRVSPFDEISPAAGGRETAADAALDVPMDVQVIVGQSRMTVRDVMAIRRGQLVELDRKASDLVDVAVNGKLLAKGELTVFEDGRIGVSLVEIVGGRA